MDELDEFEGGEEVDYDFNLDDDLLNEGEARHLPRLHPVLQTIFFIARKLSSRN